MLYGQENLLDNVISDNWTTSTHSQTHSWIYLKEVLNSGCIGSFSSWQQLPKLYFSLGEKQGMLENTKHSSWINNSPLQYMYMYRAHMLLEQLQTKVLHFLCLAPSCHLDPTFFVETKVSSSIKRLTKAIVESVYAWTHLTLCGQALGQSTEWLHKVQIWGLCRTTCMC